MLSGMHTHETRVALMEMDPAGHAERERTLLPHLHADEQARYRGFDNMARRSSWLGGRALSLMVLRDILGAVDATALRTSASGAVAYRAARMHLNLSHSGPLLAVAVSRHPVGIDIERIRPRTAAAQAERVFCAEEARALGVLRGAARLTCFFELWTLKEAACKAVELSIWDGLGKACFNLESGRCRFDPPFPPGPWRLAHAGLGTDWRLAVAVHGDALELTCRRVDDQGGWQAQPLTQLQSLRDD